MEKTKIENTIQQQQKKNRKKQMAKKIKIVYVCKNKKFKNRKFFLLKLENNGEWHML